MGGPLARHAAALAAMVAGSLLVFGLVLMMNRPPELAVRPPPLASTEMSVAPRKPPKKEEPKPKPKVTPKKVARKAPAPPAPMLGAALGGLDLGIPALGQADLGDAAQAMLGEGDAARDLVMTESSVDVAPKPLERTPPRFPPRARAEGTTGRVTLSLLIGQHGEVLKVKVLSSSPPGVFDDAATEAVRQWRYQPALYRGRPVKVWAEQVVHFELS
ncbi:MAG: energy transducer TonB [Deltaproteobacteria bacterium]|nr:energy transducer TonB [Deltaproteobacteria bacterium]MCB9785526.1 energy transducer TonB [Deltaproteobacteria bacterium]